MFVGREKELKQLNSVFSSQNKELGVIYGRRRIRKTKLIDQFVKDNLTLNVFIHQQLETTLMNRHVRKSACFFLI